MIHYLQAVYTPNTDVNTKNSSTTKHYQMYSRHRSHWVK